MNQVCFFVCATISGKNFHCIVYLPLSVAAFEKEKRTLEVIRQKNNIPVDLERLIDRMRKKMIRGKFSSLSRLDSPRRVKWLRLPYMRKISHQIARILKNYGYRAAFYSLATLSSISSPKDPTTDLCSPGVYGLFCGQCPAFYLGRTGRSLKGRLIEHKRAYTKNRPSQSAFAEHLLDSGHIPDLCTLKLLHKQGKGATLNALEETEICAALHRPGNHSLNKTEENVFTRPFIKFIYSGWIE